MEQPLVLITHTLPSDWILKLKDRVRMICGPVDATSLDLSFKAYYPEIEGILSLLTIPIKSEIIARMPRLRVVSNMAAGYDNIDIAACTQRRIPVGNTPGVLTEATADLTMALLLSVARELPIASQDAREGRWSTWRPAGWLGTDLNNATLGIVGMGKIGKAVAKRALSFGMNIIFSDEIKLTDVDPTFHATQFSFGEVIQRSDILSLHAPLTPSTRRMINRKTLRLMKPNSILINAARGQLVDTPDLVQALKSGWIKAAALDVTDPEPLPPVHPLFTLPNCFIVPHIGSATAHVRRRMAEMACDNLLAGLEGCLLPNCVNPGVYPSH